MNSILYVLNTIVKILIASISIYIFLALVTFLFNWRNDINLIDGTLNIYRNQNGIRTYGNVLGLIVAHSLTFKGFGIASFLFSFTLFKIAIKLFLEREINVLKTCKNLIFGLISISTFLALFSYYLPKVFYGKIGYTINYYLIDILGTTLTAIFIAVFFIFYLIFTYNGGKFFFKANEDNSRTTIPNNNESTQNEKSDLLYDNIEKTGKEKFEFIKNDSEEMISEPIDSRSKSSAKMPVKKEINEFESEVVENNILDTETVIQINIETGQLINSDRYLEYILPVPDLLEINIKKRGKESGDLNQTKIEILKLFNAFNIPAKITAIIESKRVTTFEISLSQGYPVVKLEKHLKDFRLRLGEKDLRFIIPMPGRTTVGLEIPNKNFYNLLFGTLVNSKEFINSQCIMPIALGQKLDNSFCILDLTKMPHLLIAGATGQGKSVCLHAIILSLLFKMKPSELKLILIDPKKVELNAYKRISKAFYFKDDSLRNYQTENEFILQTILDLEYEMENRYNILARSGHKDISEYNNYVKNKLTNSKRDILPYIVMIVDEFSDLSLSDDKVFSKSFNSHLNKLAGKSRAAGIHLIIATQRPSVKVITGDIKANFPARIAFRVSSTVDSRTILESGDANSLLGSGDMLVNFKGETIRVQGCFVSNAEVEKICNFIKSQKVDFSS